MKVELPGSAKADPTEEETLKVKGSSKMKDYAWKEIKDGLLQCIDKYKEGPYFPSSLPVLLFRSIADLVVI